MDRYSQAGNSFVIVDDGIPADIPHICGDADGVIVVGESAVADVRMRIFNNDGSAVAMCGNGICCTMAYFYNAGRCGDCASIETESGILELSYDDGIVTTTLPLPSELRDVTVVLDNGTTFSGTFLDTGVPHYVVATDGPLDIESVGSAIRHHDFFAPEGTNVDFVERDGDMIYIRTYERGVEGETLACGTGAAAAALASGAPSPVVIKTHSGETLTVSFERIDSKTKALSLTGTPMKHET